MFKRLMRWLCGPELSPYQRLCGHILAHRTRRGDGLVPPLEQCAVPPDLFMVADARAEELVDTEWPADGSWPTCNKPLVCKLPNGHIEFMGVEIFPDPSVTEFMSR